jgi:hypothetical protein
VSADTAGTPEPLLPLLVVELVEVVADLDRHRRPLTDG